jgi:hypothetical protein
MIDTLSTMSNQEICEYLTINSEFTTNKFKELIQFFASKVDNFNILPFAWIESSYAPGDQHYNINDFDFENDYTNERYFIQCIYVRDTGIKLIYSTLIRKNIDKHFESMSEEDFNNILDNKIT